MRTRLKRAHQWLKRQARVPLSTHLSKCSDLFELAGLGCLVGAAWWLFPVLGLFTLACVFIYLGWVTHVPS